MRLHCMGAEGADGVHSPAADDGDDAARKPGAHRSSGKLALALATHATVLPAVENTLPIGHSTATGETTTPNASTVEARRARAAPARGVAKKMSETRIAQEAPRERPCGW